MNQHTDPATLAAMLEAYDEARRTGSDAAVAIALDDARYVFRLRRKMQARPLIGWNPALERITDGRPPWRC